MLKSLVYSCLESAKALGLFVFVYEKQKKEKGVVAI